MPKAAARIPLKPVLRVKAGKSVKKMSVSKTIQWKITSFPQTVTTDASQFGNAASLDHDQGQASDSVNLEAIIDNTGMEWVSEDEDSTVPSTMPSWADVAAVNLTGSMSGSGATPTPTSNKIPDFGGASLQHKAELPPVFLGYNRMSSTSPCLTLIQLAGSVASAMGNGMLLDAIQPMRYGWYIYMRTLKDQAELVNRGITVAGRHIMLQSEL